MYGRLVITDYGRIGRDDRIGGYGRIGEYSWIGRDCNIGRIGSFSGDT